MAKQNPNVRSVKQFKRPYVPKEPVDPSNRVDRKEPQSPTKTRKRQGVALGNQSEARPGQVGWSDYTRRK